MSEIRVKIIKPNHPHTGEFGTIEILEPDDSIKLNWLHMALVKLENCPHGVSECFVQKGDVKVVP